MKKRKILSLLGLLLLFSSSKAQSDSDQEWANFTGHTSYNNSTPATIHTYLYPGINKDGIENNELIEPVIILEGFDLYNNSGIGGLRKALNFGSNNFIDLLRENGKDVILVDYANARDYIQNNAFALESLIKTVNRDKIGNAPIQIYGLSMGGIIANYALLDMENNNVPHMVDLLSTIDSPHQGANIPFSYQILLAAAAETSLYGKDDPAGVGQVFSSNAALQLIRDHIYGENAVQSSDHYNDCPNWNIFCEDEWITKTKFSKDDHILRKAMLAEIQSMGSNPSNFGLRKIALANGAGDGLYLKTSSGKELSPGSKLYDLKGGIDIIGMPLAEASMWIKTDFADNSFSKVFSSEADAAGVDEYKTWYYLKSNNYLDGAPGGYMSHSELFESDFSWSKKADKAYVTWAEAFANGTSHSDRFSFLPITSALDIQYMSNNITDYNPTLKVDDFFNPMYGQLSQQSNYSPYDAVYYDEYNSKHYTLSPKMGYFLCGEVNLHPQNSTIENENFTHKWEEKAHAFMYVKDSEIESSVDFSAGEAITFLPGVHIKTGSDFTGEIETIFSTNCELEDFTIPESFAFRTLENNVTNEFEEVEFLSFSAFPNPASDIININYELDAETGIVSIINFEGKELVQKPILNSIGNASIDLSEFNNGFYFIRVITDSSQKVQKIVITK